MSFTHPRILNESALTVSPAQANVSEDYHRYQNCRLGRGRGPQEERLPLVCHEPSYSELAK